MLENITFKTELSELITLEEVAVLFDSINQKAQVEMISLSMFPKFNKLRDKIIKKTVLQRNAELSQLLVQIANRKQEIKINIWKALNIIGTNKKQIQNNHELNIDEELEQIIYEEEQIIRTYENCIKALERKEKKIMNGKYSKVDKIKTMTRKKVLKKQLINLKENLYQISIKHDNCFSEFLEDLDDLVESATFTKFPKSISKIAIENYVTKESIMIKELPEETKQKNFYSDDRHEIKDYYLYEPNKESFDDELIYQLLASAKYESQNGTINGLSLTTEMENV